MPHLLFPRVQIPDGVYRGWTGRDDGRASMGKLQWEQEVVFPKFEPEPVR
tara:strand:- start:1553 stop:1702 length:150 start_codon:yes stop_codon:yes gene_type:complete